MDASAAAAFLSTLSLRRATGKPGRSGQVRNHFYPRSPCGERLFVRLYLMISSIFLSTLSLRRATVRRATGSAPDWRISIHALLAESDGWWSVDVPGWILGISIHALLAESDQTSLVVIGTNCVISIHALLAESDMQAQPALARLLSFLSTLSLRRATVSLNHEKCALNIYFYPRSPCGERLARDIVLPYILLFLSTLSLRRAT